MQEADVTSETTSPAMDPPPWQGDDGGTRITRVRTIVTAPEGIILVVVKVETNRDGLYGLGCATFTQRASAVVAAVEDYVAPHLVGRDPADITDIWQSLYTSSYWRSGPVLNNALSGVDMALWDIKGKQAGLPVWQLLGGRCRVAVPVYGHASGADPAEVVERVGQFMADGYGYVRCQVAIPGAATYGVRNAADGDGAGRLVPRAWEPSAYVRTVPRLFARLRDELGEDVELLHDVHSRLNPAQALTLAKELEPAALFFLEDLLATEDLEWLPQIRAQASTPLAIGELFTNPNESLPLIRDRLIDFLRCHVSAIGGITPALRLANTCELFGVRTAWHGPGDVSPVGHAANLALDLVSPNFGIQERHEFNEAAHEVFPGCPAVRDGHLWPSDTPGLGVDLDEDAARRYAPTKDYVSSSWRAVRRADGTVQRP